MSVVFTREGGLSQGLKSLDSGIKTLLRSPLALQQKEIVVGVPSLYGCFRDLYRQNYLKRVWDQLGQTKIEHSR